MKRGAETRAILQLMQTLQGLPKATVHLERGNSTAPDLLLDLAGHRYVLEVKSAGQGFPQDVARLLATPAERPGTTVVVFATTLSPGARALLEDRGQSYVDEDGHVYLSAPPGLFVHRTPGLSSGRPQRRSGWSPGFALTAELLLSSPTDELPPITRLAERLPLSAATIGKALLYFDAEGWTQHVGAARGTGARRVLQDRAGLLGSWARWIADNPPRDSWRGHASWQDPWAFLHTSLAASLPARGWCLTGWSAADLLAPFSTALPTLQLYVRDDRWAEAILAVEKVARPVDQGERIVMAPLSAEAIALGREGLAWPVASTPRIYADLLRDGSRGSAAADHLRESCLDY